MGRVVGALNCGGFAIGCKGPDGDATAAVADGVTVGADGTLILAMARDCIAFVSDGDVERAAAVFRDFERVSIHRTKAKMKKRILPFIITFLRDKSPHPSPLGHLPL